MAVRVGFDDGDDARRSLASVAREILNDVTVVRFERV
jgi:hypothetical protein